MNDNTMEYHAGFKVRASGKKPRIPVKCRQRNRFIPVFLAGVAVLSVISLGRYVLYNNTHSETSEKFPLRQAHRSFTAAFFKVAAQEFKRSVPEL